MSGSIRSRWALAAAAVAVLAAPSVAQASAIHVPCTGPGGGAAGLVAAVGSAPSGATVALTAGCTYTLTAPAVATGAAGGADGLPVVAGTLRIAGNGATIARAASAPEFRIAEVGGVGSLTLDDVTLRGGRVSIVSGGPGTWVALGGGVFNAGELRLVHGARVTASSAAATASPLTPPTGRGTFVGAGGGGIYSPGDLTLGDARVDHDTATATAAVPNAGPTAIGGGITAGTDSLLSGGTGSTLTADHATIDDDTASATLGAGVAQPDAAAYTEGGGLVFTGSHAAITASTLMADGLDAEASSSNAQAYGGGAWLQGTSGNDLSAVHATGNHVALGAGFTADSAGGGLMIDDGSLAYSQIDHNTVHATSLRPSANAQPTGGGLFLRGTTALTGVDVQHNTITADGEPGGRSALGGGVRNQGALTWRLGSIVANTVTAPDSGGFGGGLYEDAAASASLTGLIITGNDAGDIPGSGGGIYGVVTLDATLVLGNAPNDCTPPDGACH